MGRPRKERRTRSRQTPRLAALALCPGVPVPVARPRIDPMRLVSWRRFLPFAPLFLTVVMIDAILEVPPIVQWKAAVQKAGELFFGDGAILPWQVI